MDAAEPGRGWGEGERARAMRNQRKSLPESRRKCLINVFVILSAVAADAIAGLDARWLQLNRQAVGRAMPRPGRPTRPKTLSLEFLTHWCAESRPQAAAQQPSGAQ